MPTPTLDEFEIKDNSAPRAARLSPDELSRFGIFSPDFKPPTWDESEPIKPTSKVPTWDESEPIKPEPSTWDKISGSPGKFSERLAESLARSTVGPASAIGELTSPRTGRRDATRREFVESMEQPDALTITPERAARRDELQREMRRLGQDRGREGFDAWAQAANEAADAVAPDESAPGFKAAEKAGSMIGGVLPFVAEGAVPGVGGALTAVHAGLGTFADEYEKARAAYIKQGYSEDEAAEKARHVATRAGLGSAAVFSMLPKVLPHGGEEAAKTLGGAALKTVKGSGEAAALMAADKAQQLVNEQASYNPGLTKEDAAKQLIDAALEGAVLGAMTHGPVEAYRFFGSKTPPGGSVTKEELTRENDQTGAAQKTETETTGQPPAPAPSSEFETIGDRLVREAKEEAARAKDQTGSPPRGGVTEESKPAEAPALDQPLSAEELKAVAGDIQAKLSDPFKKPVDTSKVEVRKPESSPEAAPIAKADIESQSDQPLEFKNGELVVVRLTKRADAKDHMAHIVQMQPDGSATVKLSGEDRFRQLEADQIFKTKTRITNEAKRDELTALGDRAASVKADADEFTKLVHDYGFRDELGWYPVGASPTANGFPTKGQAIQAHQLRKSGVENALRAVGGDPANAASFEERAKALPALERMIRDKFGAEANRDIDSRRALRDFGKQKAPEYESEQRAGEEQRILDRIAAENPNVPELNGLRRADAYSAKPKAPGGAKERADRFARDKAIAEQDRLFGTRTILVESKDGSPLPFNGYKDRNSNVVLLDARGDRSMLATAAHELGHHMESSDPALFQDMGDAVFRLFRDFPKFFEEYRAKMEGRGYKGRELHDVNVLSEIVCDFIGDCFKHPDFLQMLADREPKVFKRFTRLAQAWLAKIIAKAKTLTGFGVEEHITDLKRAQEIVAASVAKFGRQQVLERAGIERGAENDFTPGEAQPPEDWQMSRKESENDFPVRPRYENGMTIDQVHEVSRQQIEWQNKVADWVNRQPANKPLVFGDGPNRKALISPEPGQPGKWRTTRFVNKEPWGHMVFDSRAEAVVDALSKDGFKDYEPDTLFSRKGADEDSGDFFNKVETVAEQKARTQAEDLTQRRKDAQSAMIDRSQARLVADEDTRTGDMFSQPEHRTTRQDKSGQGSLFSRKPEEEKNLVAVHNLTAENLMHADRMGGLPVPSIAITRADKVPFSSYGEISLVGSPELVTPSRETKVLNADAYSPRYPKVDVIVSYADGKKITAAFHKYLAELPSEGGGKYHWQPAGVLDRITDSGWDEVQWHDLARYAFARDKGLIEKPAPRSNIDEVRQQVDSLTKDRRGEIAAWIKQKVADLGVDAQEKIFKGFNNSGNRSYLPHNLDNVVKIMKQGFRDGEGFNYGAGSVRSVAAKQFRTLKQIQADRDKITDSKTIEALKEETQNELTTLADEAMQHRANPINGFGRYDAFSDDLKAMAEGGAENFKYLREQYPGGEPFPKMREYLEKLRNMPTEYFEAKPRRAVSLQEFHGAVVPDTTAPEVIENLKRRGLDVLTYPKGDTEARRAAVQSLASQNNALFSRKENPVWRDNILDALGSWQNRGTPQQLLAHLQKTKGAMDQAEWIGLDDFLKDKPSVTREQVAQFVRDNTVDVQEVTKGVNNEGDIAGWEADAAKEEAQARKHQRTIDEELARLNQQPDQFLLFSRKREEEKFYSRLNRAVEDSPQGKASGAQWKATIKNRGVNEDEFAMAKVADLEDGKSYTKQEVLDYLKANQVKVVEKVLSSEKEDLSIRQDRLANADFGKPYDNLTDSQKAQVDDFIDRHDPEGIEIGVKYSQHVLPGEKRNYREVFLTMPAPAAEEIHAGSTWLVRVSGKDTRGFLTERAAKQYAHDNQGSQIIPPEQSQWNDGHSEYSDVVNPVVRLRVSERTTADGKNVLFIDEIQPPNKGEFEKMPALFQKQWREMAFKWALKEAADKRLDGVSWTTGEQQAERYDLSKHIRQIRLIRSVREGYSPLNLIATSHDGNSGIDKMVTEAELPDYIGKDAAEKLLAQEWTQADNKKYGLDNTVKMKQLSGLDLKVGGEGLKKLYDTDFHTVANKIMDKAKLQGRTVREGATLSTDAFGAFRREGDGKIPPSEKVHYLPVSESDAAKIGESGFAQFSRKDSNDKPQRDWKEVLAERDAAGEELDKRIQEHQNRNGKPAKETQQAKSLAAAKYRELTDELRRNPGYVRDLILAADKLAIKMEDAKNAGDSKAASDLRWHIETVDSHLAFCPKTLVAREYDALREQGLLMRKPEPTRGRSLDSLVDDIQKIVSDSPPMTWRETLRRTFQIEPRLNQIRDKMAKARVNLATSWEAFKKQYKAPPIDTPFDKNMKEWKLSDEWTGRQTHEWMKALNEKVPNPIRRMAMTIWLQAHGDESTLRYQATAVPKRFVEVFETARRLTAKEKEIALDVKRDFERKENDAIAVGLMDQGHENYGAPQMWDILPKPPEDGGDKKESSVGNWRSRLDPRDPFFSKRREHPTYFDGIMAGGVPKTLDIGKLVGAYNEAFHKTLSSRAMIKNLLKTMMPDGLPAVKVSGSAREIDDSHGGHFFVDAGKRDASDVTKDGRPYRSVDHWALKDWKLVQHVGDGRKIYVNGEMLVHPDIYEHLRNILEPSQLRTGDLGKVLNPVLGSNAYLKASKLAGATFHMMTIGEHMLSHLVSPFTNGFRIDLRNPKQQLLVRHGLELGGSRSQVQFEDGVFSHGGALGLVPGVGDFLAKAGDALFKDYIPAISMKVGLIVFDANMKRYGKELSEDQIAHLTATQMNAASGLLNYRQMGRSKGVIDAMNLMLLAPQFLEARSRVVAQALKPYGAEQRKMLAVQFLFLSAGCRLLNALLDDDPHWEWRNWFSVIHNGRAYSIRTIVGDAHHLLTDPGSFFSGRLAAIPKIGIETLTQTDMRTGARKEPPIQTNNAAFRVAQNLVVDLARWLVPAPLEGLLPDASGRELTPMGVAMSSVGIGSRKETASNLVRELAADFNRNSDDPEARLWQKQHDRDSKRTSDFRKLDTLLDAGELEKAKAEYDALVRDGHEERRIAARYHRSAPWTGSRARDREFEESLDAADKVKLEKANKEHEDRSNAFGEMLRIQ